MLAAAAVVLVGGIVYLVRHGFSLPDVGVFHGEPSDLCSVGGIIRGVFSGSGRGLIQLGLLLLIATPVARVVLLLVGFAMQRDRLYVLVSLAVLIFLLSASSAGDCSVRRGGCGRRKSGRDMQVRRADLGESRPDRPWGIETPDAAGIDGK